MSSLDRKTYCDYGSYLRSRGVDKQVCELKSEIDANSLTNGGIISGDLIIRGDLLVEGSQNIIKDFIAEDLFLEPLNGNTDDTFVIYINRNNNTDAVKVYNDVSSGAPELVFAIDGSAGSAGDLNNIGRVHMYRGATISGDLYVTGGDISGNIIGYVKDASYVLIQAQQLIQDASINAIETQQLIQDASINVFFNIYDLPSNTIDVSYALFYNDVSINGLLDVSQNAVFHSDVSINGTLQVGTTSTYITTDRLRITDKLDVSNNLEMSGNVIITNNNSLKTRYINPIDANGIEILDYNFDKIFMSTNKSYINLDSTGIDIDTTAGDIFIDASINTIQLDAETINLASTNVINIDASFLDVSNNSMIVDSQNIDLQIGSDSYIQLDNSGIHLKKDIISSNTGITLIKDNSNNQPSRLYGEIITLLDISGFTLSSTTSTSLITQLKNSTTYPNGIIYSNSDASGSLYYNDTGGELLIDVSGNKNYFIDSFFEIYLTTDISSSASNNTIKSYFDLSGVNTSNRFTIDTRSFEIKKIGTKISATFGPTNFLTGSDGLLNDTYRLVGDFSVDKSDATFNNLKLTLKQKIL